MSDATVLRVLTHSFAIKYSTEQRPEVFPERYIVGITWGELLATVVGPTILADRATGKSRHKEPATVDKHPYSSVHDTVYRGARAGK